MVYSDKIKVVFVAAFVALTPNLRLAAETSGTSETLYVEVREAIVRGAPRPWAPPVEKLAFGTPITVLRHEPGWVVLKRTTGDEAFVSESALTTKRVVLKAQAAAEAGSPQISGEDVVLAGKGFSDTVEASFKTADLAPQYAMLDTLESRVVSADAIDQFIRSGGLVPQPEVHERTTP